MKKTLKSLFISMFMICLNISNVSAIPLPGIEPFVTYNQDLGAEEQTWIKQPENSEWCVYACTDVALSYLQVLKDNGTITAEGAIAPGVMAEEQEAHTPLNITMPFNQIGDKIERFSHNNPQITCTRVVIYGATERAKKERRQEAYDKIYKALQNAQLQQTGHELPEGQRPGIAILHFSGGGIGHACITYGFNASTNIEVFDPEPERANFNVTRNAFRYMVGAKPRNLSEYYLIQW